MPQSQHHIVAKRSADMADQLRDLARRVRHLLPSRHDPEAFHVAKDEIEQELRLLARTAGKEGRS